MYKNSLGVTASNTNSYTHKKGFRPLKHHGFRYVVLSVFIVSGAMMVAIFQFGAKLDTTLQQPDVLAATTVERTAPELPKVVETLPEQPLEDESLQLLLQDWVATHSSQDWSVVVQEAGDDTYSASVRPNSWYVPASVYKLMMTYTLFNRIGFDNMRTTYVTVDGKKQTLDACVDAMLRYSDNPCGEAVGKYLGWFRVEADLHKLGLKNTFVNRKDTMFSTAADAALYMNLLYQGKLFGERETNYVISTLQQQRLRAGIPKGCSDCVVANKTGDLGNVRHDVALIEKGGKKYVLAIFTSGAPYSQIAELTSKVVNQVD